MNNYNFNNYSNEPPEYGFLTLSFMLEPVSLQSSSRRKELVKTEIRKVTSKLNYLLSGDVKVEIQWMLHEQERYESGYSPDIDNIIKPILDGLSGPEGILIDDCQVQTIGSHWLDWTREEHRINIEIRYLAEDFVPKANLVFVNVGKKLYMPFHTNINQKANELILESLLQMMKLRKEVMDETADYHKSKLFKSGQRFFHKNRVYGEFQTMEIEEFKTYISKKN
ncbi:RusA family crossover junction endodeoxyribonuclease [Salinimicrobium sp. WS361]|uniref:RusA family crossover junction endodeoxyribonuclease n=1 Tax=Salinimicrobium sp. WS361 TaxID=3425123 RepID=UPI003D701F11